MKGLFLVAATQALLLGACMPAFSQPQVYATPVSETDLQSTAAVLVQQTLQSQPTFTSVPSETPIVFTPSQTATKPTATETVNPIFLTLTSTLLAGTVTPGGTPTTITGTPPTEGPTQTSSATTIPPTLDGTPKPLISRTQPANLPSGTISLFNKADVEVYISLRCITKGGNVTILEYPVRKNINVGAPAGSYTYIAWVGGRQFDGGFSLEQDGFITITFSANKVNVKKN